MSKLFSVSINEGVTLKGYIAIDSTINGYCHGGIRMASDLSQDSIAKVARVMTLKYGFFGLPVGGAKAGIAVDPEIPQDRKRQILVSFGQAIRPFLKTKSFVPSGDIGTNEDDIQFMLKSIGLGNRRRGIARELSGFYTSITLFTSAVAAAKHIGLDLNRATVAIEGFGNVGVPIAQAFWKNGTRVKAISTSHGGLYSEDGLDVAELIKLYRQVGNQVVNIYPEGKKIDKSQLAELDVDIFLPCAQPFSINKHNASRILAKIICPGANAPITDDAEQILFQRGILSVPDFVANCGGVLGSSMKHAHLREDYIRRLLEQTIGEQTTWVIESAAKENLPPSAFARKVAMERFMMVKAAAEKNGITNRFFNYALKLYRKGLIPPMLTTPIAYRYFKRRLNSQKGPSLR